MGPAKQGLNPRAQKNLTSLPIDSSQLLYIVTET